MVLSANGRQKFVKVFESGKNGYKSFRIPAIVGLPNGNLLAFCEGRVNGSGDFGDIDIVMRRSSDRGNSWSELQVVADNEGLQAGNPAPVVDLSDSDYPKGRIFLFYNTGNKGESEIIRGEGIKRCFFKTSADGGITWSKAFDITSQVHRPNQPSVDSAFHFSADWRYYANTPGHALQMVSGPFKGRIFVAANHSWGAPQKAGGHYVAHGYYTDDHGKSFQLGQSLNFPGSNESTATELSGGRIMMNSRNQRGDVKARIVSLSSDGGSTWERSKFDTALVDPVCQGSILNICTIQGNSTIAFCNPADAERRNNLTLRISFDEGKSWVRNYLIYGSQNRLVKSPAAYSDLVKLPHRRIGILFEKDDYSCLVFTSVKWSQRGAH